MAKVTYKRRDQILKELLDAQLKILQLKNKTCEKCIYKPKRQGIDTYAEECGLCSRFYGDGHTTEEQRYD